MEELSDIDDNRNAGRCLDVKWILEINKKKPIIFTHSIADLKDEVNEIVLGKGHIDTAEGKNINCGC